MRAQHVSTRQEHVPKCNFHTENSFHSKNQWYYYGSREGSTKVKCRTVWKKAQQFSIINRTTSIRHIQQVSSRVKSKIICQNLRVDGQLKINKWKTGEQKRCHTCLCIVRACLCTSCKAIKRLSYIGRCEVRGGSGGGEGRRVTTKPRT